MIDSPILPDELEILPALLEQARFPAPSGLLATHADWDHLLARLAFPEATLGCALTSAERMRSTPGAAQRELRAFDEEHYVRRPSAASAGSVQALDVPGGCEIGSARARAASRRGPHLRWDGRVDRLGRRARRGRLPLDRRDTSAGRGGSIDAYLATLERLRPLVSGAAHVVPGHGPGARRRARHDCAGGGRRLSERATRAWRCDRAAGRTPHQGAASHPRRERVLVAGSDGESRWYSRCSHNGLCAEYTSTCLHKDLSGAVRRFSVRRRCGARTS